MKKNLNSAGEMLQDDNFVFLKEWQLQEANEDMLTSSAWYSLSSGPCPDFVKQVVGILIHIPLTAPSANSQVFHKSGWLVWESEECHFLLADAPVPDTSGMPRVIAHWSALVCVCVCVCVCACARVSVCEYVCSVLLNHQPLHERGMSQTGTRLLRSLQMGDSTTLEKRWCLFSGKFMSKWFLWLCPLILKGNIHLEWLDKTVMRLAELPAGGDGIISRRCISLSSTTRSLFSPLHFPHAPASTPSGLFR